MISVEKRKVSSYFQKNKRLIQVQCDPEASFEQNIIDSQLVR